MTVLTKTHLLVFFSQYDSWETEWQLGCARFAKIASELTKTWSSGATEFWAWIGNCNVKVWKSTEDKLHKIWNSKYFSQISAKRAHPRTILSQMFASKIWSRCLKNTCRLGVFVTLPAGNFTSFPRDSEVPADLYWDHDETDNHIRDTQMHYKSVDSGPVEVSSLEQCNEDWKNQHKSKC